MTIYYLLIVMFVYMIQKKMLSRATLFTFHDHILLIWASWSGLAVLVTYCRLKVKQLKNI